MLYYLTLKMVPKIVYCKGVIDFGGALSSVSSSASSLPSRSAEPFTVPILVTLPVYRQVERVTNRGNQCLVTEVSLHLSLRATIGSVAIS